jgi:hypothetical protein
MSAPAKTTCEKLDKQGLKCDMMKDQQEKEKCVVTNKLKKIIAGCGPSQNKIHTKPTPGESDVFSRAFDLRSLFRDLKGGKDYAQTIENAFALWGQNAEVGPTNEQLETSVTELVKCVKLMKKDHPQIYEQAMKMVEKQVPEMGAFKLLLSGKGPHSCAALRGALKIGMPFQGRSFGSTLMMLIYLSLTVITGYLIFHELDTLLDPFNHANDSLGELLKMGCQTDGESIFTNATLLGRFGNWGAGVTCSITSAAGNKTKKTGDVIISLLGGGVNVIRLAAGVLFFSVVQFQLWTFMIVDAGVSYKFGPLQIAIGRAHGPVQQNPADLRRIVENALQTPNCQPKAPTVKIKDKPAAVWTIEDQKMQNKKRGKEIQARLKVIEKRLQEQRNNQK